MMKKKKRETTVWGIYPQFLLYSFLYAVFILILNYVYFPNWTISFIPKTILQTIGLLLLGIGIPICLLPALRIDKFYAKGELATDGVYAYARHPVYGSWILLIVPGLVLLAKPLLGLTIPFIMYAIFHLLIIEEEEYLRKKFRKKYTDYEKKVGRIFPKIF